MSPLFYLVMAPTSKSSEAGNLDMQKGNPEVALLSEKVCTYRTETVGIQDKNHSSICGFRHPLRGLECDLSSTDKAGLLGVLFQLSHSTPKNLRKNESIYPHKRFSYNVLSTFVHNDKKRTENIRQHKSR